MSNTSSEDLEKAVPRRSAYRKKKRRADAFFKNKTQRAEKTQSYRKAFRNVNPDHRIRENETPLEHESADTDPDLLYHGSRLTRDESTCVIWSYIMKHKPSQHAVQDLLELLNLHLPRNISVQKTLFLLKSSIDYQKSYSIVNYCKHCNEIISCVEDDEEMLQCFNCNLYLTKQELEEANCSFLYFDPRNSMMEVLRKPEVADNLHENLLLRNSCNSSWPKHDIVDGDAYKKLHLQRYDFSCTLNTDGVSPWKSSSLGFYPVFVSINELSYSLRRKHTILLGLWYGSNKPAMGSYLDPIFQKLSTLSVEPLEWHTKNRPLKSHVFFPTFVTDSVARCVVMGISQFNGAYGCFWCLQKGRYFQEERKWIYPVEGAALPRTHRNLVEHAEEYSRQLIVKNNPKPVFGVKNASPLLLLPKMEVVEGNVFDVMHTGFLGVARAFTLLWIDSKNHNERFYIGRKTKKVNAIIRRIKVPSECNRYLRSLTYVKQWKASEWKLWMSVATIVLFDSLPSEYLAHFNLFANSIMLLCDETIEEADVIFAEYSLKKFVTETQNLYGSRCCSFNLHLLLHASECVRRWGPLWAYSTFQFENANGVVSNLFKGSCNVIKQVANRISEHEHVLQKSENCFVNTQASDFFLRCTSDKTSFTRFDRASDGVVFVGNSTSYGLNQRETMFFQRHLQTVPEYTLDYKRCIVKGKIFSSTVTQHRMNSVATFSNNKMYVITRLLFSIAGNTSSSVALGKRLYVTMDATKSYVMTVNRIAELESILALKEICVRKFVSLFDVSGRLAKLVALPNSIEKE